MWPWSPATYTTIACRCVGSDFNPELLSHISDQQDCAPRSSNIITPELSATFMSFDDDPFASPVNDISTGLPQTPPTHSSTSWMLRYSSSQTHPADSPTFSPPTIGLRLGNRTGRNLIREGAVILGTKQHVPVPTSPTPRVPKYYRGKARDRNVINELLTSFQLSK